jgi:uncharacterized protein YdaU (DUF1376 family)
MLPEQEGAFFRLLLVAWGKGIDEPSLAADDATLAVLSRLGKRWPKLGPLIREQFVERDGRLYNAKLSEVWAGQQVKHTNAVERGKLGGRPPKAKVKLSISSAKATENQLERELEKEEEKTLPPPPAKAAASDEVFDRTWAKYPRRAGGNSRADALKAWKARLSSGVDPLALEAGVERYAAFVRASGDEGTKFVKQAATFFGPSEHWLEEFAPPVIKQTTRMPTTKMVFENGWYVDVPA